jgi:hypothetical protein
MKRIAYLSLALITVINFSACHKNSTVPGMQATIVGKWNMQKQTYVQYVNDIKQVDTVCLASDTTAANVQFNADKSFKSIGIYLSNNSNNPSNAESEVSGTYTDSNSAVTVSNTMAGFLFFPAVYNLATNYNINTAITNQLHTSKLNAITSTTLSIHTEDSYTATGNSVSTNYKMVTDFYYTK